MKRPAKEEQRRTFITCSEVLEHKAKPRKKTEEISGLKLKFYNPIDVLLGWDHWSLLLTAGCSPTLDQVTCDSAQPNPENT